MSRATPTPVPASRPTVLDYFLILAGCALSLVLIRLSPVRVEARPDVDDAALRDLVEALPDPMRLPEGVVLLWPVFLLFQKVAGRQDGLGAAEWLWVIAFAGVVLLTGLGVWERRGTPPEWLTKYHPRHVWYLVFVPTLAALALLFLLGHVAGRAPRPWTHAFSLALVSWPVVPLAGILAYGRFV